MFRRLIIRVIRGLVLALVLVAVTLFLVVNFSSHDGSISRTDPATARRTGFANDFLAAPPGTTRAKPEIATKVYPVSPGELMSRLVDFAMSEPRVETLHTGPDAQFMSFVQRSAIIGFPDYITVRAIAVEGGSALIVYSRSRYGQYDFGVNRARVEAWLAALEQGK